MPQTPAPIRPRWPYPQPLNTKASRPGGFPPSSTADNDKAGPSPDPSPGLATVDEAAGYLRVDPRSLRRWIAAGEVRIVRFGRAVRVPWHELHRLATAGIPGRRASDPDAI